MLDEVLQVALGREPDGSFGDGIRIRLMKAGDLPELEKLSPPHLKPTVQFFAYTTLVADAGAGELAGYTQFALTPDGILHSYAIRVGEGWKSKGIGRQLMAAKMAIAKAAGGKMHFYAVDPKGDAALKRILIGLGMHLCLKQEDAWVYSGSLIDEGS